MTAMIAPHGGLPLVAPHASPEGVPLAPKQAEATEAIPFADILRDMVATHNAHAHHAEAMADAFSRGTLDDIHGTMIAVKQADIELRMIANVRNKLLDAFNDLWRMNV